MFPPGAIRFHGNTVGIVTEREVSEGQLSSAQQRIDRPAGMPPSPIDPVCAVKSPGVN